MTIATNIFIIISVNIFLKKVNMKSHNNIPVIIQPKKEESAPCCDHFTENVKVSSCFIINAYCECIKDCDDTPGPTITKTTKTVYRNEGPNVHTSSISHRDASLKECCECLCLCGVVPLVAQIAVLPFTLTYSAVDTIRSCQQK